MSMPAAQALLQAERRRHPAASGDPAIGDRAF